MPKDPDNEATRIIDAFYGGIVRDDESPVIGGALNVEELDIWSNRNIMEPEQIVSAESLPASTEIYSFTGERPSDVGYGYGKDTAGTNVQLFSLADAGGDNPGNWGKLTDSANTANPTDARSPIAYHETTESTLSRFLYYLTRATDTWTLRRWNLGTSAEASVGTLSGMVNSFARPWTRRMFGELFFGNGQYISKIAKDGTFTEKAWTAPSGWETRDMIEFSDKALVICSPANRLVNRSKGFIWDLTATTKFDDHGEISMGGAQWIESHLGLYLVCCAINGKMRFFQLKSTDPLNFGEVPYIGLSNIGAETSAQPISPAKAKAKKDRELFFGLFKTDKSGIYSLGRIDDTKPLGLRLAKRFDTSDYSLHKPTGLMVHGPNFFTAFDDNGTADASRCESNNSPARSSNATYESIIIDNGIPIIEQAYEQFYILTKLLPASVSIALSMRVDDAAAYTTITREDGSAYNTDDAVFGQFKPRAMKGKLMQFRLQWTSSATSRAQVRKVGYRCALGERP